MWVAMQKVMYLRHTRLLYIATRVRMRVLYRASRVRTRVFLKESRIHTKKTHFKGIFGHFQTLVSSRKF